MIEILGKKYITEKEAANRYPFSSSWFQRQRWKKLPPHFIKIQGKGKIYYEIDELDRWFKENMKEI